MLHMTSSTSVGMLPEGESAAQQQTEGNMRELEESVQQFSGLLEQI